MTQSEAYFERFCKHRKIPCRRVPEAVVRTPDYEITADDVTIVVEVKQIEPNAKDRKVTEELARGDVASQWVNMSRARQSILDGTRQLRAYVRNRQPGLVVLCEVTGLFGYLDGDSIAQCLYGPKRVHVAVPTDAAQEPWVLGGSYGGGRIATDRHNTKLSAVAVLQASASYDSLTMFHNTFAARPIDPQLFRFEGVRHFVLARRAR
jgi:hypothetical protein